MSAPPRLHCGAPPSTAPPRRSARQDSRVESSRFAAARIPLGQTSRAAPPANGREHRGRGCIAHNRRRPSRLPHEAEPRTRPTDAMNRRPRDPRSCGRSVAALYNEIRPHSAIGNQVPAALHRTAGNPIACRRCRDLAPAPPPAMHVRVRVRQSGGAVLDLGELRSCLAAVAPRQRPVSSQVPCCDWGT
jgi:hypothetical protein